MLIVYSKQILTSALPQAFGDEINTIEIGTYTYVEVIFHARRFLYLSRIYFLSCRVCLVRLLGTLLQTTATCVESRISPNVDRIDLKCDVNNEKLCDLNSNQGKRK